jgi:outer membrane protein assembly factor BamB
VAENIGAGPVIFVGSYVGGVYALDAETGTQVWSNPGLAGVTELVLWRQAAHADREGGPPLPERRVLLASSGTTGLWGLDPETGKELWRRSLPAGGASAPVPIAGALLFSASQLGVFLVSPLGGEMIDGIHMADGSSMTPAAFGNRAYVLTNGGSLLSLRVMPPSAELAPNRNPI